MDTVILLAGLLCDQEVWEAQAWKLRKRYDVRVMNFPDFDSIEAMAANVLEHAPPRFSLAGHSMGGRVALDVFRQAPQRLQKLALLDTGYDAAAAHEAETRGRLVRSALAEGIEAIAETWARPMLAPCNLTGPEPLDRIVAMVGRMSGEIYARQTRVLLSRPDASGLLPRIQCPTLVLCGSLDAWSPPERHQRMAALLPCAKLRLVEDCGHMSTMERPAQVLAALEEWLENSPPTAV
jgi:pimeloyl-ACP methyl ester carboxylesterase